MERSEHKSLAELDPPPLLLTTKVGPESGGGLNSHLSLTSLFELRK